MRETQEPTKSAMREAGATEMQLRICVLGPFDIAWKGPDTPFPKERLHGRGAAPALGLLKALLSRPDRFATRDWLLEQFWPESAISSAQARLDDVASGLRALLRSPGSSAKILHYVYSATGRGSGYRLESYPGIWVDADALSWTVEQAARFERFGHDALPLWEQAHTLGSRGSFLPEEVYSDWAQARREELSGQYQQCVHRLSTLLRERGATEQALLCLRTYWQAHPTDEDALRPLMELLGEQERYQEAEEYYQQCVLTLSDEDQGRQPDLRTSDLREFLRTRYLQRKPVVAPFIVSHQSSSVTSGVITNTQSNAHKCFSDLVGQARVDMYQVEGQKVSLDGETLVEQGLESYEAMDRREAAKRLGLGIGTFLILPQSFLETFYSEHTKPSKVDEETLNYFGVLTQTCLQLSEGSYLGTAERVLWSYLPEVEAIAKKSFEHQRVAASLASQGYLIAASLVGHRNDLQARQRFSEQAWLYGSLAQDCNLQVAALRQLAVTFDYLKHPKKVLQTYQRALPYLDNVAPRLRGCIYAALSGVYAQMKQKQEAYHFIGWAYEHFPEKIDAEPHFLRLINANYHTILLWDGLNQLELDQPQMAEKTLAQLDILTPKAKIPERIRIELLIYRSKTFAAVKQLEPACLYLEAALKTSLEIGSARRLQESFTIFQQIREQWPHEKHVQQLGDLFLHTLINHVQ